MKNYRGDTTDKITTLVITCCMIPLIILWLTYMVWDKVYQIIKKERMAILIYLLVVWSVYGILVYYKIV